MDVKELNKLKKLGLELIELRENILTYPECSLKEYRLRVATQYIKEAVAVVRGKKTISPKLLEDIESFCNSTPFFQQPPYK